MPLRVSLRPYEQVMINGAVITNLKRRAFLSIQNHAQILQGKYVMKEAQANSPIRRIYFAVQMAYVNSEDAEVWRPWAEAFLKYVTEALEILSQPEMRAHLEQTIILFEQKAYYKALRHLQDVIEYEDRLFAHAGNALPPAFGDGLNPPGRKDQEAASDDNDPPPGALG